MASATTRGKILTTAIADIGHQEKSPLAAYTKFTITGYFTSSRLCSEDKVIIAKEDSTAFKKPALIDFQNADSSNLHRNLSLAG
ncbi:hypothetical protein OUZ56_010002 [Daphnia magna]|uniref:Uncharacterized protein n=1 Tax=Daphnia magna TaxID=35525 RepID=A0ABR0AHL4_9CRUS|nr:hypothetical protein OUZ56_010002 [Daphnia magna]